MKEYKIIKQPVSWRNSQQKFEDELNNYAKQGWRVVNVYSASNGLINALLEKNKDR
jgi:hypothetical protein